MVVFTVVPSVRGNYFIQPHLDVSDMEYEVNIFQNERKNTPADTESSQTSFQLLKLNREPIQNLHVVLRQPEICVTPELQSVCARVCVCLLLFLFQECLPVPVTETRSAL